MLKMLHDFSSTLSIFEPPLSEEATYQEGLYHGRSKTPTRIKSIPLMRNVLENPLFWMAKMDKVEFRMCKINEFLGSKSQSLEY